MARGAYPMPAARLDLLCQVAAAGLYMTRRLNVMRDLGRLRLRGAYGVQDEFTLAKTAQNLRKPAKLKLMVIDVGS